ncbi:hypothetical protein [Salipaludibacillus sp. CF4.18]|uniref:hypothetical protein n=1 Tax=Salipaludibacillus sp. CF4.18 TaxID=3373081 RepID=UPI003EE4C9AE
MDPYHKVRPKQSRSIAIEPSIKLFVISAEIDYYLMNLKEALDTDNTNDIRLFKRRLSSLVKKRENLLIYINETSG